MAQQTSVEWVLQYLNNVKPNEFCSIEKIKELLEQAKEMEKEQIYKCASFWRGKENDIEKPIFDKYYNETFKK
jgi:endonuclease III-like uncharacterized protein